jgi:hypothetical protein
LQSGNTSISVHINQGLVVVGIIRKTLSQPQSLSWAKLLNRRIPMTAAASICAVKNNGKRQGRKMRFNFFIRYYLICCISVICIGGERYWKSNLKFNICESLVS